MEKLIHEKLFQEFSWSFHDFEKLVEQIDPVVLERYVVEMEKEDDRVRNRKTESRDEKKYRKICRDL